MGTLSSLQFRHLGDVFESDWPAHVSQQASLKRHHLKAATQNSRPSVPTSSTHSSICLALVAPYLHLSCHSAAAALTHQQTCVQGRELFLCEAAGATSGTGGSRHALRAQQEDNRVSRELEHDLRAHEWSAWQRAACGAADDRASAIP